MIYIKNSKSIQLFSLGTRGIILSQYGISYLFYSITGVTIADLYSNGPLPYVPVLQSDLPASPFQLDLRYDCDADSVTLIFCSDNVASIEDARASQDCYVAGKKLKLEV